MFWEYRPQHETLSRLQVRAVCVWSIKGKHMALMASTQRFPKPLLRNLCSDWWSRASRRPRSSQSERTLKLGPRPGLVHVFRHENPQPLSEVAHSASLSWFRVYVGAPSVNFFLFFFRFLCTFKS